MASRSGVACARIYRSKRSKSLARLDDSLRYRYAGHCMRASSRKLLLIVLGLLVLAFIVHQFSGLTHVLGNFSGARLWHAVRNANPYLLLLSVVAIYGCYALRALRWKVFQQNLGPASFWTIYKLTLAGFAAVFLLGRAGEPVRPLLLARKEKLPFADMFGIYVLERLFDTAATAVIAAVGLIVFNSKVRAAHPATSLETAAKATGTVLFVGVIVALGFLVYLRLHGTAILERRLRGWIEAHGWKAAVARIVLGFARGIQTIRTWGQLALAVLFSGLHWFLVLLVYVWVSHSFGGKLATIGMGDAMLVMAFSLVGSTVQLPGVGGGSQVATFLAYTTIFGVETEPAAAAAIVLWLTGFAMCSLAGIPLLIHEGWSLGELRKMAEHEDEVIDEAVAGTQSATAHKGESPE